MRAPAAFLAFASIVSVAPVALALQQPDGTTIPTTASLQGLFDSRGEGINALNDAATIPETYVPGCALTFTVLQRDGAYNNAFGWYNVTGSKPADSELHEFLACTDAVGTVKVLDIKNDPNYAGGEIAFYEATGPCGSLSSYYNIFYSQKAYNIDGTSYIHMLTYDSTVEPQAFYFCWEDLLSGGDNDFNDLTTYVTGITCSGGGGACDTGQLGICADGTMQCQAGALTCLPTNQPGTEVCDGVDNDCNGQVDEGDICPVGQICDKGTCVPKCGSGEFTCAGNTVCDADGYCVDPACVGVDCPEGQKCVAGTCKAPCDGITCPHGQVCRVGVCVDPCGAITCDASQVCVLGACVDGCGCAGCGAGFTCQVDGTCIADACVGVTCQSGTYCDNTGNCVDSCTGAQCPSGQTCQAGACVDGGSGAGGGSMSTGNPFGAGGGETSGVAQGGAGSSSKSGAGGGFGDGGSESGNDSGCGCRAAGSGSSLASAFGLGALAALLGARRRRARR